MQYLSLAELKNIYHEKIIIPIGISPEFKKIILNKAGSFTWFDVEWIG